MSKESRLTIRLTDDLDAWLAAQAALNGLDKAAFARMLMFRAMNGQAEADVMARHPLMAATHQAVEPIDAQGDEVETDVDIEALVATKVQEAEASGKLRQGAPVAETEDVDPAMAELGMRPFQRAPPPHFGDKSPRIQRSSTWAPGGR